MLAANAAVRGRCSRGGENGDGGSGDQSGDFEDLVAKPGSSRCSVIPAELGVEFLPKHVILLGGVRRLWQLVREVLPKLGRRGSEAHSWSEDCTALWFRRASC